MYHLVNKEGNPKDFYTIVKEKKKIMRAAKGLPLFLCSVHTLYQCIMKS